MIPSLREEDVDGWLRVGRKRQRSGRRGIPSIQRAQAKAKMRTGLGSTQFSRVELLEG